MLSYVMSYMRDWLRIYTVIVPLQSTVQLEPQGFYISWPLFVYSVVMFALLVGWLDGRLVCVSIIIL